MKHAVPFHRSIALKALLVLVLIVVLVSLVSGFASLRGARVLLTQQLSERGLALARNLGVNAGYGVYTEDVVTLTHLLDGIMQESDVLFAVITDTNGKVLVRRVRPGMESALTSVTGELPGNNGESSALRQTDDTTFLLLSTPVTSREVAVVDEEESFLVSFLDLGLTPNERLDVPRQERQVWRGKVHLALSLQDIERGMDDISRRVFMMTMGVILVGAGISAVLVRLLVRPLLNMAQVTAQVGGGDLSVKLDVRGNDEVAVLGRAFNQMTEALAARDEEIHKSQDNLANANQQLANLNATLEERVARRTRELREKSDALEASNRELALATERKSRFLASLAHELRTPLNSVIGFSEALRDGLLGALTERQLKYVNNIVTGGRHILDLSGGILDLSKIEAGTIDVRLEPLDVVQALHEIVTITEPQAASRRASFALDTERLDGARTYLADRAKFKQVMYNLVSNAIKFSPDGGTIRLTARTVDDALEISVSDSGPGIPEHQRDAVFEEFVQLEEGEQMGGSGLGLSITRKLVELHGGRIWVEQEASGGARFVFRMPSNPPLPAGSSAAT